MGGNVIVIASQEQWKEQVKSAQNDGKAIVVDFFAEWCPPCRLISPYFEELSNEMEDVVFLKVDVDTVEAIASEFGIAAMPTFMIIKDGQKVDEVVGAAKERLKAMISKYRTGA